MKILVHQRTASAYGVYERLTRCAEPWLSFESCSSLLELEYRLPEPDVAGWFHSAAGSEETPAEVIERARRFRYRITTALVDVSPPSRQFLSALSDAQSSLVITLDKLELPGRQIRGAMRQRVPFCYGAQMLDALIPEWRSLDPGTQDELQQLFVEMRFSRTRLSDSDARSRASCEQVLARHGIVSYAKVRSSLHAFQV